MAEGIPAGIKVLITNNTLASRAGSELYALDLAIELMKRGHRPVMYSTVLGDVAEDLRRATIPVIDDLNKLNTPPDVIHGQHHLDTMTAALHFPSTPVVYTCHGWLPWEELPPLFPSVLRYVAVDDLCRERLLTTGGIPVKNIEVLYNFVDMERFQLRSPLPAIPESVLIFSNYASGPMVETIRSACRKFGITRIDVAGFGAGNMLISPQDVIGRYDLVFAKAKCALEAMASGCAVIVADFAGLGGLVTTENLERMRRLNFGVRTMQTAIVTEDTVLRELYQYNADDAREVSLSIRQKSSMTQVVDRWLQIYAQLLTDWQLLKERDTSAYSQDQLRNASAYLRILAPVLKTRSDTESRAVEAEARAVKAESNSTLWTQTAKQLEMELEQIYISRSWRLVTLYRRLRAWTWRR